MLIDVLSNAEHILFRVQSFFTIEENEHDCDQPFAEQHTN